MSSLSPVDGDLTRATLELINILKNAKQKVDKVFQVDETCSNKQREHFSGKRYLYFDLVGVGEITVIVGISKVDGEYVLYCIMQE